MEKETLGNMMEAVDGVCVDIDGQKIANEFMEAAGVVTSTDEAVRGVIPTMLNIYRAGLIMGRVGVLLEAREQKDEAAAYTDTLISKARGQDGRKHGEYDNETWLSVHDYLQEAMNDAYKQGYIQARKDAAIAMDD